MRKTTGSKSLRGLFLITAFFCLATHQPLDAQGVITATLTANDSTPNAGDTITLTASFNSPVDELASGAIYDLGAGNNNGQTGGTIIGSSATLSGLRATVVRSFTIPSSAAAGSYTFRARAEDINGSTEDVWKVVTVQSSSTPTPAPNQAPTVTLSARDSTIKEDGSTTLTASASDADGTIVTYAFSRGSTLVQSGPLNTYSYNNPMRGTHSFTVTVTDDDGASTTSDPVTVRVTASSEEWADLNADGIFDRILATLERPVVQSVGGISEVTVNGVILEIEEIIDDYLDPSGSLDTFLVSIRVPSSLTPVGFNYQFQHATTADSWINAGSVRPGSTNGIYECPIDGTLSQTEYFALPLFYRLAQIAKASAKVGSIFQTDANHDGVEDDVQEVSIEVREVDDENDEMIIVVDCPQDVTGCDTAVIEMNGIWSRVDDNADIISEVDSNDTDYPSGITSTQRVYRLTRRLCWGEDDDLATSLTNLGECVSGFGFADVTVPQWSVDFQNHQMTVWKQVAPSSTPYARNGVLKGDTIDFRVQGTTGLDTTKFAWSGEKTGTGTTISVTFNQLGTRIQSVQYSNSKKMNIEITVKEAVGDGRLTWLVSNPTRIISAALLRSEALNYANTNSASLGGGPSNGRADAARHAYLSGILTIDWNTADAKGLTTAHEVTNLSEGAAHNATVMDLENNDVGISLVTGSTMTRAQLDTAVRAKLNNGELTILDDLVNTNWQGLLIPSAQ